MDAPRPKNTCETEARDYVEFLPITQDEEKIARVFAELLLTLLERDGHPALKVLMPS